MASLQALPIGRTVLLIGDEALGIYKATKDAVLLLDRVPWQADNFLGIVSKTIQKDCRFGPMEFFNRPIVILNDMTDQHFKGGQRVAKVGVLDRTSVLKRKLNVAFPNHPMRGALKLAPEKGLDDGNTERYLFAGVPPSEQVANTVQAAIRSMADISGFFLLPIESSSMVTKLEDALAKKDGREKAEWVVFIGQHHGGALRQIIVRKGQLAMTRMTPVVDSDDDPERWAQEVNNEFMATVSYLSRFGFTPEDGVDIIVTSNPEVGSILGEIIDLPCRYYSFTSTDIAHILKMRIGTQDDPRYADILHVSWVAKTAKFNLPMFSNDVDRVRGQRLGSLAAILLLIMSSIYLTGQMGAEFQKNLAASSKLNQMKKQYSQAKADNDRAKDNLKSQGIDINYIRSIVGTYESFEATAPRALPVLAKLSDAMGGVLKVTDLKVNSYNVKQAKAGKYDTLSADERKRVGEDAVQVIMTFSFPKDGKARAIKKEIAKFITGLVEEEDGLAKDYKIFPVFEEENQEYTAVAKGVVGKGSIGGKKEDDKTEVIEVVVIGPLKENGDTGT